MSFLPDFTHENLYPPEIEDAPTFVQIDPAFTMASALLVCRNPVRLAMTNPTAIRLMASDYAKPKFLNRSRDLALR